MRRTGLGALGLALGLVLAAAGLPAAADIRQVDTPKSTYYVVDEHRTGELPGRGPTHHPVCENPIGGLEICPRISSIDTGDPDPRVHVSVWEETNGCEDLQRAPVDCDLDRAIEPADERVHGLTVH